MPSLYHLLVLATALHAASPSPIQVPFQAPATSPRSLRGRFLQITDIHPDPHYRAHSSLTTACHRKRPKKHEEAAGYYGTPYSECDSPFTLTNFTLDFLDKNWASELDFVIWTGDNARHDNDRKLPRTPDEIYDLNRAVARRMDEIFLSRGIPVVPSLGNNDVWPHNILTPGPNSLTNEYSSIWKKFIPFPYHQVFQRGAYYSVEVVPNQIAVIALNTMYFYDSNKAVGGCPYKEPEDPGNLQLDWLDVQLKMYRERGLHVYISGHVPPSPGNYFPECYVRYAELALRYQDTILGHLFGHMNADHFAFIEAIDLEFVSEESEKAPHTQREELYETLLREYAALPQDSDDVSMDDYAVINVSPPVVPNPYLPTFRVFSYNITENSDEISTSGKNRHHGHRRGNQRDKDKHCKLEPYASSWKCHLNETWHSDPESPSRSNRKWTPLGYAQYYLPDLDKADEQEKPHFRLEYMTFRPESLHPSEDGSSAEEDEFHYPIPLVHLPRSLRNGSVTASKFAPYELEDLTIGSWVNLARKIGDRGEKKLRKSYRKYMYLGGEEGK
ncbi:hypothetical protein AX16_003187 [Volvariella volvacea WC 439]|nr:hypothetical protein AX16_003187 [Volvariella volvacea WC 439]